MLSDLNIMPMEYAELEDKYGKDNAQSILRLLEQFEGISEMATKNMSQEKRLANVFRAMTENMLYQTRH